MLIDLHATHRKADSTKTRVAVIIPAFNEAGGVGRVLGAIPRELVDDITVVNDHSTDGTVLESIRNGATHVVTSRSRGVGAAIKTGYHEGLIRGADVLLVLAGDGQHDPHEIPKFLELIRRGVADYVAGDRLTSSPRRDGMSPLRFFGNRLLTVATRAVTGIDVKDSQCGYTAITREALMSLDLERITDSWGVPNDFLIECACRGLRVKYVPVKARAGFRPSYIRLRSYIPRMAFILFRGALRIARSRMDHGQMHWSYPASEVGEPPRARSTSVSNQQSLQSDS